MINIVLTYILLYSYMYILNIVLIYILLYRPDQFNFREHGFFSTFEESIGREKKENKKKSPIFCVGFEYQ